MKRVFNLQFTNAFGISDELNSKSIPKIFTMKKIIILSLLQANICFANTISIDVGHNLNAPGAISAFGDSEFLYNQAMAISIAKEIGKNKKVNLIGYHGDISKLEERTQLAKGSNLFISVHHDSIHEDDLTNWEYNGQSLRFNDHVRGFGIFVSTKNPHFEQSLACAKIIAQNLLATGFTPNYYHNTTQKGKKRELFFSNMPVYQYDNLVVLKTANIPAILIEAGVIINRYEAKWIAQENIKQAFAKAVSQGVQGCLN